MIKLKQNILAVMDREALKKVIADLRIEGVDRRSYDAMIEMLSRTRRAKPSLLIEYLSEKQVKAVCEIMGLTSTGRRKTLVSSLLSQEDIEVMPTAKKRAKDNGKVTSRKNQRKKESTHMSEFESTFNTFKQSEAPVRLPDPPAGMIRVTKTELVWPGKYNVDGTRKEVPRVNLPFQVIETVNESRATREAKKSGIQSTLFDVYEGKEGDTFEDGWRNKLIWGDNLLVMGSLLEKFAGKIDLIYIDPPFATGADFSFTAPIGELDDEVFKEQSIIEEKAYRDTWGPHGEKYPDWICQRLILCRDLLTPNGSIYVHLDPTIVHAVKVIMDEIFGHSSEKSDEPGFRNEIIWCYSGGGIPKREFPRKHDVLLWFTKTARWTFNTQYRPYSEGTIQRGRTAVKGDDAKLRDEGTPINDWWPDIKRMGLLPTEWVKSASNMLQVLVWQRLAIYGSL